MGSMAEDDPGAADNLLVLNPADDRWKDSVGEWKDGATYTGMVTLRQLEPGKFEVLNFHEEEGHEGGGEDGEGGMINEPQGANAEAKGKGDYSPAVASMMEEE